jgi:hypothetical protein
MVITQQRLLELFEYKDGQFIDSKTKTIKKPVPITAQHRYNRIVIDRKVYGLHRMIFLYHKGYLPNIIDHIDNDRTNNRIENLREATQQQNCLNRVAHKNNRSGYKNVHWNKAMNKWAVQISIGRKRHVFGYFDDVELAGLVAQEARDKFHGEFSRH